MRGWLVQLPRHDVIFHLKFNELSRIEMKSMERVTMDREKEEARHLQRKHQRITLKETMCRSGLVCGVCTDAQSHAYIYVRACLCACAFVRAERELTETWLAKIRCM